MSSFKSPSQARSIAYSMQSSPTSVRSWVSQAGESQGSVSSPKLPTPLNTEKLGGEMRRLSDRELQEKRSKGLCFRCDKKWSMGHKCKKRELSVLVIDEGEEEGTESYGSEPPMSPTTETIFEVNSHPEVSLNSVIG